MARRDQKLAASVSGIRQLGYSSTLQVPRAGGDHR